jgi:FixJ family two-component response regulator
MADGVVYVIDDDVHVRRALCRLLDSVNLSNEAFPAAEAFLAYPLPDQPSCLILDLNLKNGLSGLALQAQLGARQQTIPIIFTTGKGNVRASVRAMKAGAFDFLENPVDPDVLLERVRNALALSLQQVQVEAERRVIEGRLAQLTPRERQVLWLVVRGALTNRQMAAELGCREKTIKVHRGKVTHKMETASVAALVDMIQRLSIDQVRRWFGDDAAATRRSRLGRTASQRFPSRLLHRPPRQRIPPAADDHIRASSPNIHPPALRVLPELEGEAVALEAVSNQADAAPRIGQRVE